VTGLLLAALAAYGVHLVYTSAALGWTGLRPGPAAPARGVARRRATARDWLAQAGLDDVRPAEVAAVIAVLFAAGAAIAFAVFGGALPALAAGAFAAATVPASYRNRRRRRLDGARDNWPRMLEELRILTGSLGRSIPQALFEVGRRGPVELRPAFAAAHREWLITTDFTRTLSVLKERLADATADIVCETLLVAHDLGGADLDRRLDALVEDRFQDLQGRKDARAKQAGVRFARRFVLVVPIGMALAGLSIGTGRAAYQTALGQTAVAAGIGIVVLCWLWAGRLMRLPEDGRVFRG
jgi:tight adherence protein B